MAAPLELLEASLAQIGSALTAGAISSRELVTQYLARIDAYDQRGPGLNAISAVNPTAVADADALDNERRAGTVRGPLHGVPVIVKDNYETAGLQTAAGSILLAGGSRQTTRLWSRGCARRARSSSPRRTCTSSPMA